MISESLESLHSELQYTWSTEAREASYNARLASARFDISDYFHNKLFVS